MSYPEALVGLADGVQTEVLSLWSAFEEGRLSRPAFVELTAVTIARGNARAVALADMALAATISVELGRVVLPIGLAPADDLPRLRKAAGTVADAGTVGRVGRLARSEPLATAARAFGAAMRRSRHVKGWHRQVSANACTVCVDLARGGPFPTDVAMAGHKNCSCTAAPVVIHQDQGDRDD